MRFSITSITYFRGRSFCTWRRTTTRRLWVTCSQKCTQYMYQIRTPAGARGAPAHASTHFSIAGSVVACCSSLDACVHKHFVKTVSLSSEFLLRVCGLTRFSDVCVRAPFLPPPLCAIRNDPDAVVVWRISHETQQGGGADGCVPWPHHIALDPPIAQETRPRDEAHARRTDGDA